MRHNHAHAAGTCTTTNAARMRRAVYPQIGVAITDVQVKRSRPERILRSRLHAVGDVCQSAGNLDPLSASKNDPHGALG